MGTGKELLSLIGHSREVQAVAVTSDAKKAISGSYDRTIKVWNLEAGKEIFSLFTGKRKLVNTIAITPNSKWVISSLFEDENLKIWNLETGKRIVNLKGNTGFVTSIVVTSDGKRVISASSDKIIKVWNLETKKELFTLTGHTDWVEAVAVTSDSKWIISGSRDKVIKVWNLETGEKLFTLTGHTSTVKSVAVIPDSKRVLSASLTTLSKSGTWRVGRSLPASQEMVRYCVVPLRRMG